MKKVMAAFILILFPTMACFLFYFLKNPPCFGLGCTGNYSFSDTAYFTAPKSKIQAQVFSSGFVPEDADLGSGNAKAVLRSLHQHADSFLVFTQQNGIDSVWHHGKSFHPTSFKENHLHLIQIIKSLGWENPDSNELKELEHAITSINYGHKAGYCKGQTQFILVGEHYRHVQN
ncbi:MAG: hypothetical protein K1X82_09870 [Bacteroidia bacterium]|nr:hypothetical protein [Bacteroidia bacterium]